MSGKTVTKRVLGAVGAVALAGSLIIAAPQLAAAEEGEPGPKALAEAPEAAFPPTMSADALPTVQIDNGVVWDVLVAGDTAFAGGEFSNARPAGAAPGTNLIPRSNFLAFDVRSGALLGFAPSFNGRVNDIAVSPDGSRLYVVGTFTQVDGQARNRVAVFNLPSFTLSSTVVPSINGVTQSVAATNDTVYVGGYFSAINGQARIRVGAFRASDGATLPFLPDVDNGQVQGLVVSPDGNKVVLSGNFTSVENGQSNPGYGLSMVDAVTGAQLPLPLNSEIRNAGDSSGVTNLDSDGTSFYGVGWHFGGGGNMEGAFSASWADGTVNWIEDCHGDTYDISPSAGLVYMASHKHYCGNSGGFPQTNPWSHYHSTVVTKTVEGTNTRDIYGYPDHPGTPRPEILNWYPQTDIGTYTGAHQAAWAVDGNDEYVVYGGEFPRVNGSTQYGLVRYTLRENAPNDVGPGLSWYQATAANDAGISYSEWWTPTVSAVIPGSLRVSFPTLFDRDDLTLTYRVYLDNETQAGLIGEHTSSAYFWQPETLRTIASGLEAGSTHRIRVVASDPYGNLYRSPWAQATVASGSVSAYVQTLLQDDIQSLWRLGEASGSSIDVLGTVDLSLTGRMARGQTGAIAGDDDAAIDFNDSTFAFQNNGTGGTARSMAGPNTFSIEAWFRTDTSSGGKLVGFGSSQLGNSSSYDRHIYMNNAGQLYFGVYPGAVRTVNTSQSFNDGTWHHVVATLGGAGMRLYVDGTLRAERADVTSAQNYSGYWRVANDNLNSWTSAPSSTALEGELDEVAIYGGPLALDRVQAHYVAGTTGTAPNAAPTATIATPQISGLEVSLSGSGSDPDGTVVSYLWDFGDGTTATGESVTKTYAEAGTYTVTLTVTDDDDATGATSVPVTVEPVPNQAPVAAFSASADGLSVSTDASGSEDPDGEIVSYEWDFGSGYVTGAVTASHEFAEAGTYPVRLRVTDDEGAVDVAESSVTVFDPGSGLIATDAFERVESNGWGSADLGGAWSLRGPSSRFSVSDGAGRITIPASTSQTVYADLAGVSSASTRVDAVFSVDSLVEAQYVSVVARRVGSNNYIARLRMQADGGARLYMLQDSAALVGPMVQVPTTFSAGGQYVLSVEVTGTSPTTMRAKVWELGQPEPAWQSEGTNELAALQAPGSVSVFTYVPSNPAGGGVAFESITVTDPVVNPQPLPNQAPVAEFSASADGLSVSTDASGSEDPDGEIVSYEWDFGSGFVAGAVTASHDFEAAGTYSVRLRVTDDEGATDEAESSVTVLEPGSGILASDAFERAESDGWGSADLGGAWSLRGPSSRFSVSDGAGRITIPASTSQTVYADLAGVSSASTRVDAVFSVDSLVEAQYVSVVARRVGSNNYIARLRMQADGGARLYLLQDSAAALAPTLQLPMTFTAGQQYVLAIEATGTSPTTVRAKVWQLGQPEPAWQSEGTNTLAALQAPGSVSVFTYVPSNPAGGGVAFESIAVTDPVVNPQPLPNQAPVAAFSASADGLSVSTDASGSEDPDGEIVSYEWDFGSGYVTGAVTASHEFAEAGTYSVRLRVTDDEGATDEAESSVTVLEPGSGVLAVDEFERAESDGWGSADLGGAWSLRGPSSRFSVSDGAGRITIPASTSQTVYADLAGVSSASTRVDAVFSVDSLVEAQYVSVVARRVGSNNYIARLRMQADGGARLYLLQDSAAALAPTLQLPMTFTAGQQYVMAVEVTGTSPTTMRAKVWELGQPEPAWQSEGTNELAALQSPGSVSVFTYVPSNPAGGGVAFESITVTDPSIGG